MAKITTEDCVRAIVAHFKKYPDVSSNLTGVKNWKRESKVGNVRDGFKRIFRNTKTNDKLVVLSTENSITDIRGYFPSDDKMAIEEFKNELKAVEDAEIQSTENPDMIPQNVKDYFAEKDKGVKKVYVCKIAKSDAGTWLAENIQTNLKNLTCGKYYSGQENNEMFFAVDESELRFLKRMIPTEQITLEKHEDYPWDYDWNRDTEEYQKISGFKLDKKSIEKNSEYIWGGFRKDGDEYSVCITPRKHFEDTGFMDDRHFEIDGLEQAGFFEVMEGTFETPYEIKEKNKEILAKLGIQFDEKFDKFLKKH